MRNGDNATTEGEGTAGDGRPTLEEALQRCEAEIRRKPRLAAAHFRRAMVLQSLKRFAEALESHDRATRLDPAFAEAHYRKANLLMASRRPEAALASYDCALAVAQDFAPAWNDRARALRALRRSGEALASCDRAITLQPSDSDFHLNRGNVLMTLARPGDAAESYQRAIALRPDLVEAHFNLGNAFRQIGRTTEALESFDRAIDLRPQFAEAHHSKASVLADLNRPDEAVTSFDHAIALKPELAEFYNNRGIALHRLGRFDEALESYSNAIAKRPGYALAFHNRGATLRELGRLDEALQDCTRAIGLDPGFAEAIYNRGNVLKGLRRPDEALRDYDRAIALRPGLAEAHWNRAVCTLLMGRFEEGWPLYEKRPRRPELPPSLATRTVWSGAESLERKTLYVHAEQGLGDTIQFCRYALPAAEKGGEVILAVQDPLVRLMRSLGPKVRIVGATADPPPSDFRIALPSMPFAFHTDANSVPAQIPYLTSEPENVRRWKARIGSEGLRIGICWQGAKGGDVDIGRSFPVHHFAGIARLPGVRLISLQKGAGAEQLLDLPAGMNVQTFGNDLDAGADAFVDTAAVMENLDLVITSDTAVAHLAGALGRPVWLALNFVPDWRWLLDRTDSPWYPTMRLFRQTVRGDWQGVFAAMEAQIAGLLRGGDKAKSVPITP
ncbi:MAG TPA: tetratricopeptide repeat protein [Rhizomicrobium sp.]|nr:tetratricopeptide repeat protein [Rhizomicrobium sp.]